MPQGPNYGLQGGSVWVVDSSGTLSIKSGGSINVESGGVINVASGGSLVVNGLAQLRQASGSATLTNGTALVYTGLAQIVSVYATPLQTSPGTASTSPSSFQIDPARFANGTFYALGLAGTFGYAGAGTFTWMAVGQ